MTSVKMTSVINYGNRVVTFAATFLIMLWVYAGSKKFWQLDAFRFQLQSYPFEGRVYQILVWLIPSMEILLAFLLLYSITRLHGFLFSLAYLAVVSGFLIWLYLRFGEVPCGCGAPVVALNGWEHLAFNLFFICISITGTIVSLKRRIH